MEDAGQEKLTSDELGLNYPENTPLATRKEWMTASEAAEYLGIAKGTIFPSLRSAISNTDDKVMWIFIKFDDF